MDRRSYLVLSGVTVTVGLAGCLHTDPLEDDELDDIDSFLESGYQVVSGAREVVTNWSLDYDEEFVSAIEEFAGEANGLEDDYEQDIEPLLGSVADSEIIRTVEDEEWEIDGEQLREVLEELGETVSLTATACNAIAVADGDPDEISDDGHDSIDTFLAETQSTVDDVWSVWYEGGL